ncbi:lactonase family protein [Algibacter agarivorans]|uniref:Lactonase family protein n=2 Tax=Algibacter agarivorans TaxID=1109741 RepID=A0ABP9GK86_9FLAO
MYVGTYTNGVSKGLYQLQFNTETGELNTQKLAINIDNPSFLTYSPNRKYLYSTNGTDSGFLSSYKINNDGSLTLLTRVSSQGKGPCHISINEEGTKVAISNYGGGTVSIYPVNTNGSLSEASQVFNHNAEDKKSHAHSAQFFKDDLFVADLGRNAIYQYKLKNNNYILKSSAIVTMQGNPGPRHFSISNNGEFIYIINEYGSSITSVKRTSDSFELIDHDSTLSESYKGNNSCADIHLSKDERFLYGSNRGENSIAVFKRNLKTGMLDKIQNISVHGDWPRNFTLDPTGKFLLVANKKSHNISVFSIDTSSGKLTFLHDIKVPTPVCLLF